MFSEMIADVLFAFKQFTLKDVYAMSFQQFYLWYDLAIWKLYEIPIKIVDESTADDINDNFEWNQETNRYEKAKGK